MTRNENVFLAKKLFTELVFNTAYIEGVNVTFPQTQAILDGAVVNNIPVSDIQTVLNLRDAWKLCLNTLDEDVDLAYVCRLNGFVSRNESLDWGHLRSGQVYISGTEYIPPVPVEQEVKTRLQSILDVEDPVDRAIECFCYTVRSQLFWDGNKRTATILANRLLIAEGAGVLTIGKSDSVEFNTALLHYYDTSDAGPLKKNLRSCIKTLDARQPMADRFAAAKAQAAQHNNNRSTIDHTNRNIDR